MKDRDSCKSDTITEDRRWLTFITISPPTAVSPWNWGNLAALRNRRRIRNDFVLIHCVSRWSTCLWQWDSFAINFFSCCRIRVKRRKIIWVVKLKMNLLVLRNRMQVTGDLSRSNASRLEPPEGGNHVSVGFFLNYMISIKANYFNCTALWKESKCDLSRADESHWGSPSGDNHISYELLSSCTIRAKGIKFCWIVKPSEITST